MCAVLFVLGCLYGLSMCARLLAFSVYFLFECVCLTRNTMYALFYWGLKDTETYQGGISNSCPQRYWLPQPGPSRSLVPWVTPAPHNAQFLHHPSQSLAILYDYLVIFSNRLNFIWQSPLPERYGTGCSLKSCSVFYLSINHLLYLLSNQMAFTSSCLTDRTSLPALLDLYTANGRVVQMDWSWLFQLLIQSIGVHQWCSD